MKNLKVYVVEHDDGHYTIRTKPVARKWTEGPDKDCTPHEATLHVRAARSIARMLADQEQGK